MPDHALAPDAASSAPHAGAEPSAPPRRTDLSIVEPDEQLLLLVVGGPPRIVAELGHLLRTRIGIAMAVVGVQHSQEALDKLSGGGFDGVIVFDDLVGRSVLRGLRGAGRRPPAICVVEQAAPSDRAKLRSQLRHEGASTCIFAQELSAALLESAVLGAVELERTWGLCAPSVNEPTDESSHQRFLRTLGGAVARSHGDASYRFAVVHVHVEFGPETADLDHELCQRLEARLLDRLRDELPPRCVVKLELGDYVVMVEDPEGTARDLEAIERIRALVSRDYEVDQEIVQLRVRLGVARSGTNSATPEGLLRRAAEAARQRAPTEFPRQVAWLSGAELRVPAEAARLDQVLREALARGEFSLCYQPIVHLIDGRPLGFEALIRWAHQEGAERAAAEFIPEAEQSSLIVPIGYWALETAVRQMTEWDRDFELAGRYGISVNLSPRQCQDATLLARIQTLLMTTGLPPSSLHIEIGHESLELASTRTLIEGLGRLRAKVWIQRFGLGARSVEDLRGLPIDALKVDRTLVAKLDGTSNTTGRVQHVVDAARALKSRVIAEGVENQLQANVLRWLGCEIGQGFHFAHPMPVGDTFAYLAQRT